MIVTGAARSVLIKLFYQFGMEKPIFLILLYLLSQALSLFAYAVSKVISGRQRELDEGDQYPNQEEPSAAMSEMVISGLGLVFSAVASRIIRKRMVSSTRWIGIGIVSCGVSMIAGADMVSSDKTNHDDGSGNERDQWIGMVLILGQCIISVFQDLSEEFLLQDSEFPATLLGLEGLFGLVVGSIVYFPLASKFGEPLVETMESLHDLNVIGFMIGLVCLFIVSGTLTSWQ
jgi:drug/metabolite transporter (DMT)-like permease